MHSVQLFRDYERSRWTLHDIAWHALDRSRVRPEHIKLARSAVMGECNVIAAMHGFLNESTDYDFSSWVAMWAVQEIQHHFAFRTYLEHAGEEVAAGRVEATLPAFPSGVTHAATLATNVISEITVCHVYSQLGRDVDEPVLVDILARASRDEARHARDFSHYLRRRLASHPHELASVLETFHVYVGAPDGRIVHPVSVFKGELAEAAGGETIDDGFAYFLDRDPANGARLRRKLYGAFSSLTGFALTNLASVRRALGGLLNKEASA